MRFQPGAAVALAGLVVVSSVAGVAFAGVAFAGAAAAAVDSDDYSEKLDSGNTFWQGEKLYFNATAIIADPANASADERTFQIRRASDGSVGSLVQEFVVDTDGERAIDTASLDGRFVLTYGGNKQVVYVLDGVGYTASPPDGTTVDVPNSRWEIAEQTLSASWSKDSVAQNAEADLELSSNRGSYLVEVSARGLSFADLESMFASADYASNHDAKADDDVIILKASSDAALTASFSGLDPGSYTLRVEAADTTASATASITVGSGTASVSFGRTVVAEQAGDIAEIPIRFSNVERAYLVVGGSEVNVLDVVEVRDTDGNGRATVRVNTRYMGLDTDDPGVPTGVTVYTVEGGSATAYGGGETLASGQTLDDVRAGIDVSTGGLPLPARPGDYPIAIATSDDVRVSNGNLDIRDQQGVGTLVLRPPSVDGATAMAAATASAGAGDLAEVRAAATERGTVAIGDRVVVRVRASGIFGHLAEEHGGDISGLVDNAAEGLDLSVEQTNPTANRPAIALDLTGRGVRLLTDPANDTFYVVIDTRTVATTRALEAGQRYRATFAVTGIDGGQSRYSVEGPSAAYEGYPYVEPGQERSASATFRLAERDVDVDQERDGSIRLPKSSSATVSGTATLAPGTQLTVRAVATGRNPFSVTSTATVAADGTWETSLDLSDAQVDQTVRLTVRQSGSPIVDIEGTVVAQTAGTPETPTATPTETPGVTSPRTPEETPTETPTETEPSPGGTPMQTATPDDGDDGTPAPSQPGFGFVVAVLAVLAAAAVAARRRR